MYFNTVQCARNKFTNYMNSCLNCENLFCENSMNIASLCVTGVGLKSGFYYFIHNYRLLSVILLYNIHFIVVACTSDLPDMYARSPRAAPSGGFGHTYQANHECSCYKYYVTLPRLIALLSIRV